MIAQYTNWIVFGLTTIGIMPILTTPITKITTWLHIRALDHVGCRCLATMELDWFSLGFSDRSVDRSCLVNLIGLLVVYRSTTTLCIYEYVEYQTLGAWLFNMAAPCPSRRGSLLARGCPWNKDWPSPRDHPNHIRIDPLCGLVFHDLIRANKL